MLRHDVHPTTDACLPCLQRAYLATSPPAACQSCQSTQTRGAPSRQSHALALRTVQPLGGRQADSSHAVGCTVLQAKRSCYQDFNLSGPIMPTLALLEAPLPGVVQLRSLGVVELQKAVCVIIQKMPVQATAVHVCLPDRFQGCCCRCHGIQASHSSSSSSSSSSCRNLRALSSSNSCSSSTMSIMGRPTGRSPQGDRKTWPALNANAGSWQD